MPRTKRQLVAAALIVKIIKDKRRKSNKRRSVWVKEWISKRGNFGVYSQLLRELKSEDSQYYKNFLRMDAADFGILLEKVKPYIEKQDTVMRPSISAGERLALTLRFLAAG